MSSIQRWSLPKWDPREFDDDVPDELYVSWLSRAPLGPMPLAHVFSVSAGNHLNFLSFGKVDIREWEMAGPAATSLDTPSVQEKTRADPRNYRMLWQ